MNCPRCGSNVPQGGKFCETCGMPVAEMLQQPANAEVIAQQPPAKKEKKKMSKGKKIFILIISGISALLIAALVLFALWFLSPEQKILRALARDDLAKAVNISNQEFDGDAGDKLIQTLTDRINGVKTDFTANTIDYTTATWELDQIAEFGLYEVRDLLEEVREYVSTLNTSRNTFQEAESLLQAGDYKQAMDKYALVWEEDGNYQTALDQLAVAQQGYRDEVIAAAKQLSDKEDYEGAMAELKAGLTVLPNDEQLGKALAQTEESYRNYILAEAKTYADKDLFDQAIAQLETGLTVLPNDATLTEQLAAYEKQKLAKEKSDLLEKSAEYVKNGDYPSAIALLAGHEDDAEINSLYLKYCDEYEKAVLAEADKLLDEGKFDEAIDLLNKALVILPNNEDVLNKVTESEARKPVSILSLTEINRNGWEDWNTGNPTDPFGNDYSGSKNYCILENGNGKDYIEYRLYGKYSYITGMVAPYTTMEEGHRCYFQIYADDELVYTSPEIRRKTDAFTFKVDIKGADYIKIYFCANGYDHYNRGRVILSRVEVWP